MQFKPLRLLLLTVSAVALGVGGALFYNAYSSPESGGPNGDSWFATRLKNQIYASVSPAEERGHTRLTPQNANGWWAIHSETIQGFEQYQAQNPPRPTAQRKTLVLQPLGAFNAEEKAMLETLRVYCEAFFDLKTRIAPPLSLKNAAQNARPSGYQKGATQYDAGQILQKVLAPHLPPDAAAFLGVTMADLHANSPQWNNSFVFGLATWKERIGVYSLVRYFPRDRSKMTALDRAKALRRACLVLNHEAGHMFGITHCTLYKCAMNGANSLGDSDQTPLDYCPVCARKLAWNIGFNRQKRDAKVREFEERFGLAPFRKALR